MLVVADSSALITLAECEGLGLLERLFDSVRVPSAVYQEIIVEGKPHAVDLRQFLRGRVEEVDLRRFVIAAGGLGRGELQAMALYRELGADLLMIDDRRAKAVAIMNEIKTIGSLGILLFAKRQGLIPKVAPFVERIRKSQIHMGARIAADVLRLAGEE